MNNFEIDINTFIVHQDWLQSIKDLPIEQQDAIIGDFVRYGVSLPPKHEDDPYIQAFVNLLKGQIDDSKDRYKQRVLMSKTAGRKKKISNKQIYDIAKTGKPASEVASILGCSESLVNHSEGWRNRFSKEYFPIE